MRKIYSTLLLVMAMLCVGANTASAQDEVTIEKATLQNALNGINGSLTFANYDSSFDDMSSDEIILGLNLYNDGHGNYYIVPEEEGTTILAPEDCSQLFYNLTNLKSVDFTNFNTENVTDINSMFRGCPNLQSITFGENFNTSNVTDMSGMFYECENHASLNLSGFNTSSVEDMSCMFTGCPKLQSITFGENFNTSSVTNMSEMFSCCNNLIVLDLSGFSTSSVTDISSMFHGCQKLQSITFGENFNTSSVKYMNSMFFSCESLTSLDLSSFNTSSVTDMSSMFSWCTNLTTIIVGDGWSMASVTNDGLMFSRCTSLKGQNGTAYSSTQANKVYAHVDGDYGQPGYLSRADGKVKIAESLAAEGSVSFDVTPTVDSYYTFTTSDANATIVFGVKGGMMAASSTPGTFTSALAAGTTYTVEVKNNTEEAMTNLTVTVSKQAINYITLTADETTVGDMAAGASAYCKFTPTASGYYTFTASNESVRMLITASLSSQLLTSGQGSCGSVLNAGTTYIVMLRNMTEDAMSSVTVTTAKVDLPALTMGENSDITIPAATSGPTTIATFTPAKAGTYRFTIDASEVYIMVDNGAPAVGPSTPGVYEAELEADKMYAVMTYSQTATTGSISVDKIVTLDKTALKDVLFEINESRAEYSENYTITFADSNNGLPAEKDADTNEDVVLNADGTIKLYHAENDYNYVVAPTTAGDVIMAPADCGKLFAGLTNLTSVTFDNFNTSNVTNMFQMFKCCSSLTSLDLSGFDSSNVTNMNEMFSMFDQNTSDYVNSSLESITFGENFNTSNVTSMSEMFTGCSTLSTLDLSSFDTSKVEDMLYMFDNCPNLTTLTINNFDMSNVESIENMFNGCTMLNTLTMKSLPYLVNGTFNTQFSGEGKTVNVVLDDNSVVYTGDKTNYFPAVTSATYTRKMTNEWGTIVVPFGITYSQSNGNYKLYKLTKVDATTVNDEKDMTFTEYANGNIPAGTPMAIKAVGSKNSNNKYEVTLTAGSNAISTTITPADQVNVLQMTGTYTETKIGGDAIVNNPYFIANNQYWRADAETTVPPFRAWFERIFGVDVDEDDLAKSFNIVVDDETTSINNEQLTINMAGAVYNLNGQRLAAPQKGQINIINGRKVLIK